MILMRLVHRNVLESKKKMCHQVEPHAQAGVETMLTLVGEEGLHEDSTLQTKVVLGFPVGQLLQQSNRVKLIEYTEVVII